MEQMWRDSAPSDYKGGDPTIPSLVANDDPSFAAAMIDDGDDDDPYVPDFLMMSSSNSLHAISEQRAREIENQGTTFTFYDGCASGCCALGSRFNAV